MTVFFELHLGVSDRARTVSLLYNIGKIENINVHRFGHDLNGIKMVMVETFLEIVLLESAIHVHVV